MTLLKNCEIKELQNELKDLRNRERSCRSDLKYLSSVLLTLRYEFNQLLNEHLKVKFVTTPQKTIIEVIK